MEKYCNKNVPMTEFAYLTYGSIKKVRQKVQLSKIAGFFQTFANCAILEAPFKMIIQVERESQNSIMEESLTHKSLIRKKWPCICKKAPSTNSWINIVCMKLQFITFATYSK